MAPNHATENRTTSATLPNRNWLLAPIVDRTFNDFQIGETLMLHRGDLGAQIAGGPQTNFGARQILFNQRQDAGCVRNVTDIDNLHEDRSKMCFGCQAA